MSKITAPTVARTVDPVTVATSGHVSDGPTALALAFANATAEREPKPKADMPKAKALDPGTRYVREMAKATVKAQVESAAKAMADEQARMDRMAERATGIVQRYLNKVLARPATDEDGATDTFAIKATIRDGSVYFERPCAWANEDYDARNNFRREIGRMLSPIEALLEHRTFDNGRTVVDIGVRGTPAEVQAKITLLPVSELSEKLFQDAEMRVEDALA